MILIYEKNQTFVSDRKLYILNLLKMNKSGRCGDSGIAVYSW